MAEAWGSDAPSALGYLAARTERILLGSGIIQLGTRTPVAIAQAALTLAQLSDGRFVLGLGASGPQVIEGLHGVPFGRPLSRMRETVQIVRRAFAGEKVSFTGEHFTIPLPGRASGRCAFPAAQPGPDLPGHAVAEDAGADRRDRGRLARHQLRAGGLRRVLHAPGRRPGPPAAP